MNTAANALTVEHEPVDLAEHRQKISAPALTPMEMVGRALEMGVSAEILKQMMDLRDREEARNAKLAFTKAVAAAKAELRPIIKTREVDYKPDNKPRVYYRHEDLAGIEEQITPILAKNGLSYRFESDNGVDRPITITCILEHDDGHSTRTALSGPPDSGAGKNSLQAIASTTTYLQRYTLKLALGLSVSHDDDGAKSDQTVADGPITEEQVAAIRSLIKETDTDEGAFLTWLEAESIDAIPSSQMKRVEDSFAAKKRRMAR